MAYYRKRKQSINIIGLVLALLLLLTTIGILTNHIELKNPIIPKDDETPTKQLYNVKEINLEIPMSSSGFGLNSTASLITFLNANLDTELFQSVLLEDGVPFYNALFRGNGGLQFGSLSGLGYMSVDFTGNFVFNVAEITGRNYYTYNSVSQLYSSDQTSISVNQSVFKEFSTNLADKSKQPPVETKKFIFSEPQDYLKIETLGQTLAKRCTLLSIKLYTINDLDDEEITEIREIEVPEPVVLTDSLDNRDFTYEEHYNLATDFDTFYNNSSANAQELNKSIGPYTYNVNGFYGTDKAAYFLKQDDSFKSVIIDFQLYNVDDYDSTLFYLGDKNSSIEVKLDKSFNNGSINAFSILRSNLYGIDVKPINIRIYANLETKDVYVVAELGNFKEIIPITKNNIFLDKIILQKIIFTPYNKIDNISIYYDNDITFDIAPGILLAGESESSINNETYVYIKSKED